MVRAILDGRKTQTRRVAIPSRSCVDFIGGGPKHGPDWNDPTCWGFEDLNTGFWWALRGNEDCHQLACPHGMVGDRLWVRETHAEVFEVDIPAGRPRGPIGTAGSPARPDWKSRYVYLADGPMPNVQWHHVGDSQPVRWTPSIHMRRWASRITLEITGLRVERLQDICEIDAEAEGIDFLRRGPDADETLDARGLFRCLWDRLNAPRDQRWDATPWVWVVEFRRLESAESKACAERRALRSKIRQG
ncbi:hypothetical protein DIE11_34055 [Burkholderia sp. Bp9012]|nr:hypothetical protein DIE11_34055 [Burkholderia sp. Bp9012]RQZ60951.1 hypothetical protein DIE08_29735 [Burkholderia sp. Bp9004]